MDIFQDCNFWTWFKLLRVAVQLNRSLICNCTIGSKCNLQTFHIIKGHVKRETLRHLCKNSIIPKSGPSGPWGCALLMWYFTFGRFPVSYTWKPRKSFPQILFVCSQIRVWSRASWFPKLDFDVTSCHTNFIFGDWNY